jgi:hypothetical protein
MSFSSNKLTAADIIAAQARGGSGGGGGGGSNAPGLNIPLTDAIPGVLSDLKCTIAAIASTDLPDFAAHTYEWAFCLQEGIFFSDGTKWSKIAGVVSAFLETSLVINGGYSAETLQTIAASTDFVIPGSQAVIKAPTLTTLSNKIFDCNLVMHDQSTGTGSGQAIPVIQFALDSDVNAWADLDSTSADWIGGITFGGSYTSGSPSRAAIQRPIPSAILSHPANVVLRAILRPAAGASGTMIVPSRVDLIWY